MKKVIQYTCPVCELRYQLSQGVEVVNRFGWEKPDLHRDRRCSECTPVKHVK